MGKWEHLSIANRIKVGLAILQNNQAVLGVINMIKIPTPQQPSNAPTL